MPAGRPIKFQSAEELQKKIDDYFAECDREEFKTIKDSRGKEKVEQIKFKIPYTITGLALALSTNRVTLLDYEKSVQTNCDEELLLKLSCIITRAKTKVENFAEQKLYAKFSRGAEFVLQNGFGWANKQKIEDDRKVEVDLSESLKAKLDALYKMQNNDKAE